MTARRKLTTLDKLKILVRQATCPDCGGKLGALADCDFDHRHQLAMGGADDLENLTAIHRNCHKAKTARDAAARGKVRRLGKKEAEFRRRLMEKSDEDHASVRKWPKRKMQSRSTFKERRT